MTDELQSAIRAVPARLAAQLESLAGSGINQAARMRAIRYASDIASCEARRLVGSLTPEDVRTEELCAAGLRRIGSTTSTHAAMVVEQTWQVLADVGRELASIAAKAGASALTQLAERELGRLGSE